MAAWKPFGLVVGFFLLCTFCLGTAAFPQTQHALTVNVIPSQGGTVKADCSIPCQYTSGAWAHLLAIPNSGYVFSTWDGDQACKDGGTNPSLVIRMDATKSCNATFLPCVNLPVQMGSTEYPSYDTAYRLAVNKEIIKILATNLQAALSRAPDLSTLQSQGGEFPEDVTLDRDLSIVLRGGFACDFTTHLSPTVLNGKMTVKSGTIQIDGLTLR